MPAAGRGAPNIGVVQHHRDAIPGEPKIRFDHHGAEVDREGVGGQGLFRGTDAMAAVRYDEALCHEDLQIII